MKNVKKISLILIIVFTFSFSFHLVSAQTGFPTTNTATTPTAGTPTTGTGGCGSGSGGNTFANPINICNISQLLQSILGYLKTIIGTIAILLIVIGGILYMTSAGDEKKITRAKDCITAAVIGLAIVFAAPAFLSDITNILNGNGSMPNSGGLYGILVRVLQFVLSIFGTIAIIALVISGIMFMTAAGDDKQMETAKKMAKYSIYGIVVALSSLIIITQVASLIGG